MKLKSILKSDHLIDVILTTVPLTGVLVALLFYEWFGNDSILADRTRDASYCACVFSIVVIGTRIGLLRLRHRPEQAKRKLKAVFRALGVNAAILIVYGLERFLFG